MLSPTYGFYLGLEYDRLRFKDACVAFWKVNVPPFDFTITWSKSGISPRYEGEESKRKSWQVNEDAPKFQVLLSIFVLYVHMFNPHLTYLTGDSRGNLDVWEKSAARTCIWLSCWPSSCLYHEVFYFYSLLFIICLFCDLHGCVGLPVSLKAWNGRKKYELWLQAAMKKFGSPNSVIRYSSSRSSL